MKQQQQQWKPAAAESSAWPQPSVQSRDSPGQNSSSLSSRREILSPYLGPSMAGRGGIMWADMAEAGPSQSRHWWRQKTVLMSGWEACTDTWVPRVDLAGMSLSRACPADTLLQWLKGCFSIKSGLMNCLWYSQVSEKHQRVTQLYLCKLLYLTEEHERQDELLHGEGRCILFTLPTAELLFLHCALQRQLHLTLCVRGRNWRNPVPQSIRVTGKS